MLSPVLAHKIYFRRVARFMHTFKDEITFW